MKLSGPTENCLSDSLKTFETYFKGTTNETDIDNAFVCFSGALDMFVTHSRGSTNTESFSANELRVFLHKHFLGSVRLNDTILLEFMRVKQTLLGGALDRLTRTEIGRLQMVLETLRVETQRMRPYITLLTQTDDPASVDLARFEQALSDLHFTATTLGSLLDQSQQPYRLENLKTLLIEFQALYAGRSDWTGPKWFAQQIGLIGAAKSLLIRAPGDALQPGEWPTLFSHVGRLYGLYLRFVYMIAGHDMFYGSALDQIEIAIQQIGATVGEAIDAKSDDKIEYSILKKFVTELDKSDIVELPLKAKTINDLLEPVFERILNPAIINRRGTKFDPSDRLSAKGFRAVQGGITRVNWARLNDALLSWLEMQRLWEQLERDAVRQDPGLRGKPIPIRKVRELWATYSPQHQESWSDLKSLFERPLPLATYADGRLMMVPTGAIAISRDSFSGLNWKQQIVRVLGYGYVSDPLNLRMTGITLNQLKDVFDDFWQLTLDLKFLDKTDGDIWKTGFTVSNMFLFSSNSDERLSFHEAVDLFVFSFASGVISKDMIRKDVQANCTHLELDPAGIPKIKPACWRSRLRRGYARYLSSIPGWTKMVRDWDDGAWDGFFDNLEKSSRKANNPDGPLSSSEMDRAISIHHYIESLYTRWDADRDGRLTMQEADKGFFLFKKILKDASGFSDDSEVRALFFYLLTFGEPPESFGNKIYWLWWKGHPDEWEKRVNADRGMLMRIFANLASRL